MIADKNVEKWGVFWVVEVCILFLRGEILEGRVVWIGIKGCDVERIYRIRNFWAWGVLFF